MMFLIFKKDEFETKLVSAQKIEVHFLVSLYF